MALRLAQSLKDSLGLDDESVQQLVAHAERVNNREELVSWLADFVGSDSPAGRDYIQHRFGAPAPAPAAKPREHTPRRVDSPNPRGPDVTYQPSQNFVSSGVWDPHQSKKQNKKKAIASPSSTSKAQNQMKVNSLNEIDAALKQLEISESKRTKCNCMGQRHPVLDVAPNCMNCGKIICVREGLGKCTFCGKDLISSEQMDAITQILESEKNEISASMGKKAREKAEREIGTTISSKIKKAHDDANDRLNRLLNYQATGAERTRIIDQVNDFETPGYGLNQWASPLEQAQQLKRQQRQLKKLEQARLSRQGRGKKVISIDIKGNKVYAKEEAAEESDSDSDGSEDESVPQAAPQQRLVHWDPSKYGKNFIQPVAESARPERVKDKLKTPKSKGKEKEKLSTADTSSNIEEQVAMKSSGGVVDLDEGDRYLEI